MRRALLLVCTAICAAAQDPYRVPMDPTKSAVLKEFENNQVRILRVMCAAGEDCPVSRNPEDQAIVTVMSGPERGAVRWSPQAEKGPLDEVRIELKTDPVAAARQARLFCATAATDSGLSRRGTDACRPGTLSWRRRRRFFNSLRGTSRISTGTRTGSPFSGRKITCFPALEKLE